MYNLFLRCFGIAGNIKTNIMATSKISEWINDYLYISNIDGEEFVEVRNFMILWNLFEARLFNCNFGQNKRNIDKIRLDTDIVNQTLQYLKERYTEDNNINFRYKSLKFRYKHKECNHDCGCDDSRNCDYKFVKHILLHGSDDSSAIIKAIILIIYRYRNNLFHGKKEIALLPPQKDNFIYANRFLIACLEAKRE